MAMDDGKMANDVPKVDSYRAFHRKMAKSMAQNAIFTSVFLEKYFEFRKNSKYATGYWCVDDVEAIPMLSQDRNMPNDVP